MSTTTQLTIYRTADVMPGTYLMVIVAGGVATWTGSEWISQTGDDTGRPIEWDVKWWAPVLPDVDPPPGDTTEQLTLQANTYAAALREIIRNVKAYKTADNMAGRLYEIADNALSDVMAAINGANGGEVCRPAGV